MSGRLAANGRRGSFESGFGVVWERDFGFGFGILDLELDFGNLDFGILDFGFWDGMFVRVTLLT